jgi:hypothetical protein
MVYALTALSGSSRAQLATQAQLAVWCNPETMQKFTMMARIAGGSSGGPGAYYRYMSTILEGAYLNNLQKYEGNPEKIEVVTSNYRASKQYILNNCPDL